MYLITWITTHLPTPEGWMAELAKAGDGWWLNCRRRYRSVTYGAAHRMVCTVRLHWKGPTGPSSSSTVPYRSISSCCLPPNNCCTSLQMSRSVHKKVGGPDRGPNESRPLPIPPIPFPSPPFLPFPSPTAPSPSPPSPALRSRPLKSI